MSEHMTPQEAQELLRGTIPGPWAAIHNMPYISIVLTNDEDDIHAPVADITDGTDGPEVNRNHDLMAAAPTLARAIACERMEYGEEWRFRGDEWVSPLHWYDTSDVSGTAFIGWHDRSREVERRIVCRRVSEPWEVTDGDI